MSLTFQDEQVIEDIVDRKMKPLEKKIDKVITILDGFAGNIRSMEQELTMFQGHKDQLEDLSAKSAGHEKRLDNIETHLDLSSS